jgi:hypothetical protein
MLFDSYIFILKTIHQRTYAGQYVQLFLNKETLWGALLKLISFFTLGIFNSF